MNNNFKDILILSIPLWLKYIFLLCCINFHLIDTEDVFEDIFFLASIILLLNTHLLKTQFYTTVICFIFLFYVILETTSYLAVSSNFSSSYMYLLLESNKNEMNEFASSYIDITVVLFITICAFVFLFINNVNFRLFKVGNKLLSIVSFLLIIVVLKFTGLIENNAFHNIIRGTYGYINLQNSFKINSNIIKEDIKVEAENEVLVVVLGESTARGHMQIYGYSRETTPLLNRISDSLYIYNNVISTDVFTLKSMPKILTSLDVKSDNEQSVFNIVEVFNAADFNTYWLSNQRPISYHDNAISKMASATKLFKFYNHAIDKHALVMDEILLPDYKNILSIPDKKVIFIRLIGTHFDYNKRYPKSFTKFLNNVELSNKQQIKNHYDNAVLYNDYIVHSLIKELKKINKKSALLYLSDHGENIYDEGTDFFGRSEEVITKSMFEIPFLLWTSKDFIFPDNFEYVPNRKFMANHTYESIGHIFGVLHNEMDVSKSIFSDSFKPKKRIVVDGIDFDKNFD